MPVPKRKTGRAKQAGRRSSHSLDAPSKSVCPQCHSPKLPHHVCGQCGYYNGKEVIETD